MIRPFDSLMLRTLAGTIIAAMQLLAAYVLLHGHYSPGGGFQAGILLAGSFILPLLTGGRRSGRLIVTLRAAVVMAASGVAIFAAIGAWSMLLGEAMFDYAALPVAGEPAARRSLGILGIEVGVTLAVAGAMVAIFYALADPIGGEEDA